MPLEHNRIFKINDYELDLCTVLKNKQSRPVFVLVPWHGNQIAANGTLAFIGSLDNWLQRKRYFTRRSFTSALNTGKLEIVSSPAPHSTANNTVKVSKVTYSGGAYSVVAADPSWLPSS